MCERIISVISIALEIDLPPLIISGQFDEATPVQMMILKDELAHREQAILDQSGQCGIREKPDHY
jgi:hypothetical protein